MPKSESELQQGPFGYENWRRFNLTRPYRGWFEVPLYSDSRIVANDLTFGPYELINTVAIGVEPGVAMPVFIFRSSEYGTDDEVSLYPKDAKAYWGSGSIADEISALVSLVVGIRLMAGATSRRYRTDEVDVRGRPIAYEEKQMPQLSPFHFPMIAPGVVGDRHVRSLGPISLYPMTSPRQAVAILRAAKLFQDAVWIVENEPSLAWIMLVSAVETVAETWRSDASSPEAVFREVAPEWAQYMEEHFGAPSVRWAAKQWSKLMKATDRFVRFLWAFLPDPPKSRPSESRQHPWTEEQIKATLKTVYGYRSTALHGGIPFPMPMCTVPIPPDDSGIPPEVPWQLGQGGSGGRWEGSDIPITFNLFAYIARGAILKWWESLKDIDTEARSSSASV